MITNALGSAVVPQLEEPGFTALAVICQAHKGIAIYMFEFRHGVTEVIRRNGDSYQLIALSSSATNGHVCDMDYSFTYLAVTIWKTCMVGQMHNVI